MRLYLTAFIFVAVTLPIPSVASTEETWFCSYEASNSFVVIGKEVIVEELKEGFVGYEALGLKGKLTISKKGVVEFITKFRRNKVSTFDLELGDDYTIFSGNYVQNVSHVENFAFTGDKNAGVMRITSNLSDARSLENNIWFCDKF